MEDERIKKWRERVENTNRIVVDACSKALVGELGLTEAAEIVLYSDPSMQDPFEFIYPDAEILGEMLNEFFKNKQQRHEIELKYGEPALVAFQKLLDIFTAPTVPYQKPQIYPLPRSAPQERE